MDYAKKPLSQEEIDVMREVRARAQAVADAAAAKERAAMLFNLDAIFDTVRVRQEAPMLMFFATLAYATFGAWYLSAKHQSAAGNMARLRKHRNFWPLFACVVWIAVAAAVARMALVLAVGSEKAMVYCIVATVSSTTLILAAPSLLVHFEMSMVLLLTMLSAIAWVAELFLASDVHIVAVYALLSAGLPHMYLLVVFTRHWMSVEFPRAMEELGAGAWAGKLKRLEELSGRRHAADGGKKPAPKRGAAGSGFKLK